MEIAGKVAVVTGGASGIGAALARRFSDLGAAGVVVADLDVEGADRVAASIDGRALAVECDVSRKENIQRLTDVACETFGRVDIFISNAGVPPGQADIASDDAVWERMWRVHAMAHVWAARAVIPDMVARGHGYFLVTSSAAGLLSIVESAPYATTKHAAVGLAEWLRIAYAGKGVAVSCLCPQAVDTGMTRDVGAGSAAGDAMITADEVADTVVAAMAEERFLILSHHETAGHVQGKSTDYDRWLRGMGRLHRSYWESQP